MTTIIELYTWDFSDGPTYRTTSADVPAGGHTPIATSRQRPSDGSAPGTAGDRGQINRSIVEVEIDVASDLAGEWAQAGPTREVVLTVEEAEITDIQGTRRQVFAGVVIGHQRRGSWLVLHVTPRVIDLDRAGPRGTFSERCGWALYGPGCRAHLDGSLVASATFQILDFDLDDQAVFIDDGGDTIPDPLVFVGGTIEVGEVRRRIFSAEQVDTSPDIFRLDIAPWSPVFETASSAEIYVIFLLLSYADVENPNEGERTIEVVLDTEHSEDRFVGGVAYFGRTPRLIIAQDGPTAEGSDFRYVLKLKYWSGDIADGGLVVLHPGCDRSTETCADRFGNLENYRGAPAIAGVDRSPFVRGWDENQTRVLRQLEQDL